MAINEGPFCAVVEDSGKYKVVPYDEVREGRSFGGHEVYNGGRYWTVGQTWVKPGQYCSKPHLLVTGNEDVPVSVLEQTVRAKVDELNAQVASHKGWVIPKPETLEKMIQVLPGVKYASQKNR